MIAERHADVLENLVEIAKIQSTESSNKIEGIYTSDERLKKIVLDKTMPKTRNEREIAGYRDVLNTIHENFQHIPIEQNRCAMACQGCGAVLFLLKSSGITFHNPLLLSYHTKQLN